MFHEKCYANQVESAAAVGGGAISRGKRHPVQPPHSCVQSLLAGVNAAIFSGRAASADSQQTENTARQRNRGRLRNRGRYGRALPLENPDPPRMPVHATVVNWDTYSNPKSSIAVEVLI